jgi:hypothetical protein
MALHGFIEVVVVRYRDLVDFSFPYSLPVVTLNASKSRLAGGGFALGGAIKEYQAI